MIAKKKIVITGVNGFIGKNLKNYLKSECEIIGVGRNSIQSYENLDDLDYSTFIHLAGLAHDLKNVVNPQEYYAANLDLTKKVFMSFMDSEADTFIFVSSVKAVVDKVIGVLDESINPNPKTDYGKSKLLAENFILNNSRPNKRVIILRPCMIHGPGNRGNLNMLFKLIYNNIPYPLGAYKNKRSFLSVDNFSFIVKEILINSSIPSGIYNVSDDEAISTNDLVNLIYEALNKNNLTINIPKFIIFFLAKIGDFFALKFNSENLDKLTENFVVSNQKITSAIKKKLPISAKEGLIITIKEFK